MKLVDSPGRAAGNDRQELLAFRFKLLMTEDSVCFWRGNNGTRDLDYANEELASLRLGHVALE